MAKHFTGRILLFKTINVASCSLVQYAEELHSRILELQTASLNLALRENRTAHSPSG
jgi:hypothetical protein